jgi:hypothetical protein
MRAAAERWEYGTMTVVCFPASNSGMFIWNDKVANISNVDEQDKAIGGETYAQSREKFIKKFATKLKVPVPDANGGDLAIYNLLGSQGWEIVQKENDEAGGAVTTTTIFKRRIP